MRLFIDVTCDVLKCRKSIIINRRIHPENNEKKRSFIDNEFSSMLALIFSCKGEFPAKGANFRYYGAIPKGLNIQTFSVEVITNDKGPYLPSYQIPTNTLVVELAHFSNDQYDFIRRYKLFEVMVDNSLNPVGNPVVVEERYYGKTTTINFMLQRR